MNALQLREIKYYFDSQDRSKAYWENEYYQVSALKFEDCSLAHIIIKKKGRRSRFYYGTMMMPKIPKYLHEVCKEMKMVLENKSQS